MAGGGAAVVHTTEAGKPEEGLSVIPEGAENEEEIQEEEGEGSDAKEGGGDRVVEEFSDLIVTGTLSCPFLKGVNCFLTVEGSITIQQVRSF